MDNKKYTYKNYTYSGIYQFMSILEQELHLVSGQTYRLPNCDFVMSLVKKGELTLSKNKKRKNG